MSERCALPADDGECIRWLGHAGECRSTWRGRRRCRMPIAAGKYIGQPCHRRAGHRGFHASSVTVVRMQTYHRGWYASRIAA